MVFFGSYVLQNSHNTLGSIGNSSFIAATAFNATKRSTNIDIPVTLDVL